jgi:hypothetical protein
MNMKSHKSFLAKAFLLLPVLFSSCATIISGSYAEIHLDGNVDEPINVVTSKGEYNNLLLPTTVVVKRRHLEGQRILVSSENYAYSDIVLHSSVNPWSVLSAVFYGVPLLVDLSSNAAYEPTQKHFYVVPGAPIAQSDSLRQADSLRMAQATEELKQMYWKTKQLPERYCRHELRAVLGFGECQASRARDKMIDRYVSRYDLQENGMLHDLFGTAYVQAGFEYHYRLNRKWEIGALVNWGLSNYNYCADYFAEGGPHSPWEEPEEYALANERCKFFVFAPSVRYTWKETPWTRTYSRIALGAMRHHLSFDYKRYPWQDGYDYMSYPNSEYDRMAELQTPIMTDGEDKIQWRMAYQLTAIGASFGGRHFNCFGELGYGCLGIVRLGLGITF